MKKMIKNLAIASGIFVIALLAVQNLRAESNEQREANIHQEIAYAGTHQVLEGKCGNDAKAMKTDKKTNTKASKCGDGKCGEGKEAKTDKKAKASKCGDGKSDDGKDAKTEKKAKESKCGAGKCGGN